MPAHAHPPFRFHTFTLACLAAMILGCLQLNAGAAPAIPDPAPDAKKTRADFEQMAAELPCLSMADALYDRSEEFPHDADPQRQAVYRRVVAKVKDPAYPKQALLDLLVHEDPKVRTLAAVALFNRDDVSVLPALAKLVGDRGASFDDLKMLASFDVPRQPDGKPPMEPRTVTDFAGRMVALYTRPAGFFEGTIPKGKDGFGQYWETRKDLPYCASWFAAQLDRAGRATNPTPKEAAARVAALRRHIEELTGRESGWMLLWLYGAKWADNLVTEEELVGMCKKIGPDALMLMLQNKIPVKDPDMQSRTNNNGLYKSMMGFVLAHAGQLLRPGDADALLECEMWERDHDKHGRSDSFVSAQWAIAAAQLHPGDAPKILHAAMERFQGEYKIDERTRISIALWQLVGKTEEDYVVNWFFTGSSENGPPAYDRQRFIETMRDDPRGKELIARIILDPRLDQIEWQSLRRLIQVVNLWSKAPILTEDELRKAWHPLGDSYYQHLAESEQKYPKETTELLAHLEDWRKRLVASVPEWEKGDAK